MVSEELAASVAGSGVILACSKRVVSLLPCPCCFAHTHVNLAALHHSSGVAPPFAKAQKVKHAQAAPKKKNIRTQMHLKRTSNLHRGESC